MDPITKKYLGIFAAGLLGIFLAFTAGRLSAPAKIKEVEKEKIVYKDKVVEKEKVVVDQTAVSEAVKKAQAEWKKKERTRTVTKTLYANGIISERISWTEKVTDESASDSSTSFEATVITSTVTVEKEKIVEKVVEKEVYKEKLVESKTDHLRLGFGAGERWNDLKVPNVSNLTYEAHGEVRVIGGLWIGATAVPQLKFGGLTVSLQF